MIALYIDPGTGSILVSSIVALVAVGFYMVKGFIYRKLNIGGSSGVHLDTSREYSLVFYSEGGQYWHVFKPILEQLDSRGINATYLSSAQDDPGLSADLTHIEPIYVGSGRELYFFLNHLRADMLVMTTPGLDVLQIKRSKTVGHYCHITHSAAGADMYKAFGLDYYDSVLVGGDEDLRFIREIERKRGFPEKQVEIIGCTYLDVLRTKLKETSGRADTLPDKRPTVLLSPTWGEHGLLAKYGTQILSTLEQADAYDVIVRPHPQSSVSEPKMLEDLIKAFPANEHRMWDRNHDGLEAMAQADLMISDFSGIIFDFLFLFGKPVLTLNRQIEKRGRDAMDLDEEPWGIRVLERVGRVLSETDIPVLPAIIDKTLGEHGVFSGEIELLRTDMDKHPGESGRRGADFIGNTLAAIPRVQTASVSETPRAGRRSLSASLVRRLKLIGDPNTWFQLSLTVLLFVGYLFAGTRIFPVDGYNHKFVRMGLPLVGLALLGVVLIWVMLLVIRGKGRMHYVSTKEPFEWKSLLVLFLPMTPITQYIIANQDILSFGDSVVVFGFFLIGSALLTVGVSWMLSRVVPQVLSLTVTLSLVFHLLNMANLVKLLSGEKRLQVALFAIAVMVIFLLLVGNKKLLYLFSVIFFTVNIGSALMQTDASAEGGQQEVSSGILGAIAEREPIRTPDVFLIIYESYANQEMLDFYGYDNQEQLAFLQDHGFAIYDGIYTVGPRSLLSIAHLLHVDPLARFANRRDVIGKDANGLKALKQIGYDVFSIMTDDYMIRGTTPDLYDGYYPNPTDPEFSVASYAIIIGAILEGQFKVDAQFSLVTNEMYVQEKQRFLSNTSSSPRFLYTHNNYPGHSPDTGVLRPNETQLYIEKFKIANEEMRQDILSLAEEHKDAIIILAGDHGPYLTKNGIELETYSKQSILREDVQDRYGVFLAIRWPRKEYAGKFDIKILQDVLPAAFAYIYDDEKLFDETRLEREALYTYTTGGVGIKDGIIIGGADDGKPLFEQTGVRYR